MLEQIYVDFVWQNLTQRHLQYFIYIVMLCMWITSDFICTPSVQAPSVCSYHDYPYSARLTASIQCVAIPACGQ